MTPADVTTASFFALEALDRRRTAILAALRAALQQRKGTTP